ncbi:hypothetical protein BZL35_00266 [Candidatus Pandoraea novymonadis]|uniref:Uncharacterized protein n=1 Tax=Candidatus Pandoraea novymonadis TaxID=1808959 RepID=A0ABX5FEC9_9BURK|nr:hypothetical protein BZL35_00266 [Candidatus Pandoraea novymonadis]
MDAMQIPISKKHASTEEKPLGMKIQDLLGLATSKVLEMCNIMRPIRHRVTYNFLLLPSFYSNLKL